MQVQGMCVQMSPQKHVVCADEAFGLCVQMSQICVRRWVPSQEGRKEGRKQAKKARKTLSKRNISSMKPEAWGLNDFQKVYLLFQGYMLGFDDVLCKKSPKFRLVNDYSLHLGKRTWIPKMAIFLAERTLCVNVAWVGRWLCHCHLPVTSKKSLSMKMLP